jgi:IAA-amino acid hydrolase
MSAFARGLRASLALALLALVLRAPRAAADESGTVDAASAASLGSANATGGALGASSILATARGVSEYVVRVRRELHRAPELMWTERNTSALIKRELAAMGVAHSDLAPPGVVATIGTGAPPVVLLRADMDALPLTEEADIPEHLRSEIDGKMHACGHDGHVAMLLGAARVLKASEPDLPPGTILLAFQPAEEGGAGAKRMLEAGLAAIDPPVDTAFALHNWPYPETPSGVVGTRAGTIMAGSGSFEISVMGAGGHAAVPHKNVDVVVCASAAVMAMQSIVSRRVDPLDSAVLSVTIFRAGGEASNVMGDEAILGGTFRALRKDTFEWLHEAIETVASRAAGAHGCGVKVDFAPASDGGVVREEYPPTVNDPSAARFAASVARDVFGAENVRDDVAPVMPAEDFSFFGERWPSAMMWLGAYNESAGATWPLHSTKYVLDEDVLHRGVAMHVAYAVEFLKRGRF